MKKYSAQNYNFAELEAQTPFLKKNQNFIKSERFDGLFPNSIPKLEFSEVLTYTHTRVQTHSDITFLDVSHHFECPDM